MSEAALPWAMLAAAAAATYVWRGLGVLLSGNIDPASPVFEWIGAVTYALLAGLVARMIVLPLGPLQEVGLWVRLAAVAVGAAVFFSTRKNLLLALGSGTLVLILLAR